QCAAHCVGLSMQPSSPTLHTLDSNTAGEMPAQASSIRSFRYAAPHPSTAIMVKEALQALDSRKGVSSQAILKYITEKYPSVDLARLKTLVRKNLKKGVENGTLVKPGNSSATTATRRFRCSLNSVCHSIYRCLLNSPLLKDEEASTSKVAPAKKPKAKRAKPTGDGEETADSTKTKAKKTKEAKPGKAKVAKADSKVASKSSGKRGTKSED
uniref:H15 domain-containing protein n=1 Tax=Neolamprologus brichardi TaxID=32507 RepID=A0A3Q4GSJ9_NEOBR